jgi:hypothetical protein
MALQVSATGTGSNSIFLSCKLTYVGKLLAVIFRKAIKLSAQREMAHSLADHHVMKKLDGLFTDDI